MKKKLVGLLAGAMVTMALGTAGAVGIDYNSTIIGNELFSPYLTRVQTETFNNVTPFGPIASATGFDQGWGWNGAASIFNGSQLKSAAPFGVLTPDTSNFLSVPNPNSNGTLVLNLGTDYNYFGLRWGSVDTFNTITFKNNGVTVASFTGSQVVSPNVAAGSHTDPLNNLYVNFMFGPDVFDSVEFASTQFAFEMDNLAVGSVPEPGTLILLGAGIVGLGIYGRRRSKK